MTLKEFKARLLDNHPRRFNASEIKEMVEGVRIGGRLVDAEFVGPGWKFYYLDNSPGKYITAAEFFEAWTKTKAASAKVAGPAAPRPPKLQQHRGSWFSKEGLLKYVISEKQTGAGNAAFFIGSVFGFARDGIVGEHFAERTFKEVLLRCQAFARAKLGDQLATGD